MSIFKLIEEKIKDSVSFHLVESAKEISIINQFEIVPICIIGKQKVGKSTLLNQIFDCNFVSQDNLAVRSTIGVDAFLYLEDSSISSEGLLVFDTEGLKSQQKQSEICEILQHLPNEHRWECAEKFNNQSNQMLSAFLWCSCEVIIYYLNVTSPCSDDLNFFSEILKTKQQLQNAQATPHVIFAVRPANPDQYDNIVTNYKNSLKKMGAGSLLKEDPDFIHIHSKDNPTLWHKTKIDLKDMIYRNIKSRQNLYKLFPVYLSMIEGLLNALNNNGKIDKLENRISEAEDSFVFRLSEKMRLDLVEDLSSLRDKRQKATVAFQKIEEEMQKLCNYFDNEDVSNNHNIRTVTNTAFSVTGVGLGLLGLLFPPTALIALGGAVVAAAASTGANIHFNNQIEVSLQKIVDQTTLVQQFSEDLSQKLQDYLNYKRQIQDNYLIPLVLIDKYDFKFSVTTILFPDFDKSKILQTLLNDGNTGTVKNKELSSNSLENNPVHSKWRAFMAMKDIFGTASVLSRHGLIDAGKWAKTNFGRGVLTRFFGKWAHTGAVKVLPVVGIIFEAGMALYSLKEWNDGHPAVEQLLEAKSQLKPQLDEIIEIRESFSNFEDKIRKTANELKQ